MVVVFREKTTGFIPIKSKIRQKQFFPEGLILVFLFCSVNKFGLIVLVNCKYFEFFQSYSKGIFFCDFILEPDMDVLNCYLDVIDNPDNHFREIALLFFFFLWFFTLLSKIFNDSFTILLYLFFSGFDNFCVPANPICLWNLCNQQL